VPELKACPDWLMPGRVSGAGRGGAGGGGGWFNVSV